jgi:tetratricopeptide (TPR) repeat protein
MTLRSAVLIVSALLTASCSGMCSRRLVVPEPTYREAISSFYTALSAMQTTQDLLAREQLEKLTALVPGEPAGWANFGLLLMRQQELDAAAEKLAKAEELAPKSGEIQRLLGLLESRKGRLPEAIQHWKRALEIEPADLRAAYALAEDLERRSGPEAEAEAQRTLESILAREDNLAVRVECARLAAKRGDADGLKKVVAPLPERSKSWPPLVREQLQALQDAIAGGDARAAAPRVIFLKNTLVRVPDYRHALSRVSTPRAEIGEPLVRFVALDNPVPRPAAADEALAFTVGPAGVDLAGAVWARALSLDGQARRSSPRPVRAASRSARPGSRSRRGRRPRTASPPSISTTTTGPTSSSPVPGASRCCARAKRGRSPTSPRRRSSTRRSWPHRRAAHGRPTSTWTATSTSSSGSRGDRRSCCATTATEPSRPCVRSRA